MQCFLWRQTSFTRFIKSGGVDPIKAHTIFYIILLINALFFTFDFEAIGNFKVASGQEYIEREAIFNATDYLRLSITPVSATKTHAAFEYTSDNSYSIAGAGNTGAEYQFWGYNSTMAFNVSEDILNEVWLGYESYTTNPDAEQYTINAWNGSAWSMGQVVTDYGSDTLVWYNFTAKFLNWNWDWAAVNQIMAKQLFFTTETGGCFSGITYFISWNETALTLNKQPYLLKRVDKGKAGDPILCWNQKDGMHWGAIKEILTHNGTWEIYDLFSGIVHINYTLAKTDHYHKWIHHVQQTGDHPLTLKRGGAWHTLFTKDIELKDMLPHIAHDEVDLKEGEYVNIKDHYVEFQPIEKIEVFNITGLVYDIKTVNPRNKFFVTSITTKEWAKLEELEKAGVNLGAYLDPLREGKTTYYVDWFPVKIVYLTPAAPLVCIPCLFIGLCFVVGIMVLIIVLTAEKR